ncbi:MAG: hypothetical protein ACYC5G_05760, partial [Candidatus Doudnabacteria bacterium]
EPVPPSLIKHPNNIAIFLRTFGVTMNLIKIIVCVSLFTSGIITAILTYNLSDKTSFGKIEDFSNTTDWENSPKNIAAAGSGVDSSNDGVAIGLGIISGFSFLSSSLLLTSISNKKKESLL